MSVAISLQLEWGHRVYWSAISSTLRR